MGKSVVSEAHSLVPNVHSVDLEAHSVAADSHSVGSEAHSVAAADGSDAAETNSVTGESNFAVPQCHWAAADGSSHPAEGEFLERRGCGRSADIVSHYGARLKRRSLRPTGLSLSRSFELEGTFLKKCRRVNVFFENILPAARPLAIDSPSERKRPITSP